MNKEPETEEVPEEKKAPETDSEFRQRWKNLSEQEKAIARRTMGASGL